MTKTTPGLVKFTKIVGSDFIGNVEYTYLLLLFPWLPLLAITGETHDTG